MATDAWGFDEERQVLARKLVTKRRRYGWSHTGVLLILLLVLLVGSSLGLEEALRSVGLSGWIAATAFLVVLYAAVTLIGLPYAYFGGYKLDRGFGLSTQSVRSWLADHGKSFALGLLAVVLAGNVLLWLLANQPGWWWLIAWALGLAVTLVLSFLAPVVIAPLFFRFQPLADPNLRARFEALAAKAHVPVLGVFEMRASAKTRRSNAAVTGFGRTGRVVITDTLLTSFTPEEVESVLAHELGHQRYRDPLKGIVVGGGLSFVMWSLGGMAYAATHGWFGINGLGDIAGLPVLLLWTGLVSSALGPLELWWSRARESRADRFSLEITQNPAAFASAMVKLNDANLGIAHPKAWEKWLLYTHPPARERVEEARGFKSGAPSTS